jgi:pyridoxamine 5'-phosphate oxidase
MTDPFQRFDQVLSLALTSNLIEPTAMALATVGADNQPSVRMVLLKGFDTSGFVFYTNIESRKGRDLAENPLAALCFHWQPLHAQVRIEGPVTAVTEEEADEYFASRARGSQIGAWASQQSRPLQSADTLQKSFREFAERFEDGPVPRPAYWSGFRLAPERIEFWSGKPDRLHERELYTRNPASGAWSLELLYP